MQVGIPNFGFPISDDTFSSLIVIAFTHYQSDEWDVLEPAQLDDLSLHDVPFCAGNSEFVKALKHGPVQISWSVRAPQECLHAARGGSAQLAALLAFCAATHFKLSFRPGLLDVGTIWATGRIAGNWDKVGSVDVKTFEQKVLTFASSSKDENLIFIVPHSNWVLFEKTKARENLPSSIEVWSLKQFRTITIDSGWRWEQFRRNQQRAVVLVEENRLEFLLRSIFCKRGKQAPAKKTSLPRSADVGSVDLKKGDAGLGVELAKSHPTPAQKEMVPQTSPNPQASRSDPASRITDDYSRSVSASPLSSSSQQVASAANAGVNQTPVPVNPPVSLVSSVTKSSESSPSYAAVADSAKPKQSLPRSASTKSANSLVPSKPTQSTSVIVPEALTGKAGPLPPFSLPARTPPAVIASPNSPSPASGAPNYETTIKRDIPKQRGPASSLVATGLRSESLPLNGPATTSSREKLNDPLQNTSVPSQSITVVKADNAVMKLKRNQGQDPHFSPSFSSGTVSGAGERSNPSPLPQVVAKQLPEEAPLHITTKSDVRQILAPVQAHERQKPSATRPGLDNTPITSSPKPPPRQTSLKNSAYASKLSLAASLRQKILSGRVTTEWIRMLESSIVSLYGGESSLTSTLHQAARMRWYELEDTDGAEMIYVRCLERDLSDQFAIDALFELAHQRSDPKQVVLAMFRILRHVTQLKKKRTS